MLKKWICKFRPHDWDTEPFTDTMMPLILPATCRRCGVTSEIYYGDAGFITVAEKKAIAEETHRIMGGLNN